jgi:MYXO-CTERM domain-containing protein
MRSLHFSFGAGSRGHAGRIGVAIALALSATAQQGSAAGTWTMAPPNTAAGGQAFGLWLLTDGRILSHGSSLKNWVILSPDRKGDYSKGTWKAAATSQHGRGGAQQAVLKDGRFFQAGGEYVDGPACTAPLCKSGEIYDPIANTWTPITPAPLDVGDTGMAKLDDGRILDSTRSGNQIQIYDPVKDTWTMGSPMPLRNGQENSWAALQNGGVLAVGYAKDGAAIYDTATGKWQRTGPVPSGFDTGDTGGISLMFDGRVFVYGFGKSYIYTPGATGADPGTWALGPPLLNGNRAEDEFTNTMPFGKVWGGLVEVTFGPGVILQEFDPMTNMSTSVTPPPDKGNPYPIGYVNLPNGQVMVTCERNNWIYASDLQPQDEWRPKVTSVVYDQASKSYTLTGTQLSGLINGADEGDDMTMAENYPIVWLTNEAGDVFYCRTFDFSNLTPMKGNTPQTCQFTTPPDLPEGTYALHVSSVGVQAKDTVPFTVGSGVPPQSTGGASGSTGGTSSSGSGGSPGAAGSATAGTSSGSGGAAGAGPAGTGGGATANAGGGKSEGKGDAGGMMSGAAGSVSQGSGGTPGAGNTGNDATASRAEDSSSCGCRTTANSRPSALFAGLGLLGLASWRRRERSRRRS